MAILSKRILTEVGRLYSKEYGLRTCYMDLTGNTAVGDIDTLADLRNIRRKRDYALQESVTLGEPYLFDSAPGIRTPMVALEDRRMIHGGIMGGEVLVEASPDRSALLQHLATHGMKRESAASLVRRMPVWPEAKLREAGQFLQDTFYQVSGWKPELLKENKLKNQQRQQITEAIEDQRKSGRSSAIYAFEKERILLASIRAGDRTGARRILNDMLATIYLSSPQLVVLRARTIEMLSCLTRAAIEDNPLLEPLIERNHAWTENLVKADSFEALSSQLMSALDDLIDGIYLHGFNRSNTSVRKALDFIGRNHAQKIELAAVAREAGLSASRLSHLVKEFTGRTVIQIVQQVRVQHAQTLLERTAKSCAEIAYDTGFGDQSYFIKHFRRLTGVTPARYRRSRAQ